MPKKERSPPSEVHSALCTLLEEASRQLRLPKEAAPKTIEIEARLGHIDESGSFSANIGENEFLSMLGQLNASTDRLRDKHESLYTDFMYNTSRDDKVRTRVTFCANGMTMKRETITKNCLFRVTCTSGAPGQGKGQLALRLQLSEEISVAPDNLPVLVQPSLVRDVQRKTFVFDSASTKEQVWRFEGSRVRSGVRHLEAEQSKHKSLELELELEATSDYFATHAKKHIASSMLMKLERLCNTSWDRVHRIDVGSSLLPEA